jgi:hypothetical protein
MYSRQSYRLLLRTILESGYGVVDFAELDPDSDAPQVVLRHDVDFIPRLALEMAEIDSSCGVKSTFFFLPRSHAYNLFSPANVHVLQEIERYGHSIALHCAVPPEVREQEEELVRLVQNEFGLGRVVFPQMLPLFAWHTVASSFFARWRGLSVPGLINAYDDRYFSQITFISDSNARRSAEELQDIFFRTRHRKVQLLLHPVIWMCGGATMMEVFSNAWKYFVREIEVELRTNATYQRLMPHGMPDAAVHALAGALLTTDSAAGR